MLYMQGHCCKHSIQSNVLGGQSFKKLAEFHQLSTCLHFPDIIHFPIDLLTITLVFEVQNVFETSTLLMFNCCYRIQMLFNFVPANEYCHEDSTAVKGQTIDSTHNSLSITIIHEINVVLFLSEFCVTNSTKATNWGLNIFTLHMWTWHSTRIFKHSTKGVNLSAHTVLFAISFCCMRDRNVNTSYSVPRSYSRFLQIKVCPVNEF